MKRSLSNRAQCSAVSQLCKQRNIGQQREEVFKCRGHLYRSLSCPCFSSTIKIQTIGSQRTHSAINLKAVKPKFNEQGIVPFQMPSNLQTRTAATKSALNVIDSVCSCPCGPCGNCLPPPCNTPAKCLQYMTGYYYYPYGTWFCGPYHIATGPCGPCAGPVRPEGICGPAPPCPGGPCGPPCIGPCKPCGPCICGPCTPCGPLGCCGVCGAGNQFSNIPVGNPYDFSSTFTPLAAYGPFGPQMPYQYMQQNVYSPFNPYAPYQQGHMYPPPHFGPCYDVPMPMPVPINPNFEQPSYIPAPPPPIPSSPSRPNYTFSKPTIKDVPTNETVRSAPSINGPCPKNLSPKTLRVSPLSRYETGSKMAGSNRAPKMMARALPVPNSSLVCHFSTRIVQLLSTCNNACNVRNATSGTNIYKMDIVKKCKGCNNPLCRWCVPSGTYRTP